MARLALAVIVKDEKERVKSIIERYQQFFDELCFAVDDNEVYKKLKYAYQGNDKVRLFKYEWRDDFAHKRNWIAGKIESEYYFRLDTDDIIDKPGLVQKAFKQYVKDGYTLVHFMYYYSFDKSGNCTAKHWRETIIKNDGNIFWNKTIHENINPKYLRKVKAGKEAEIAIIHKRTQEEANVSTERNLKMLLAEYEQTKEKPDARTIGYIARMLFGLKRYHEAIPFFERFVATSGWEDDKYFAWTQLGQCYQSLHDKEGGAKWLDLSLTCGVEALLLRPEYPDAYFHLLNVHFDKKEYKKAVEFGTQGFTKKTPETMIPIDPSMYTWRPTAIMAMCYLQLGKFDQSLKLIRKAASIVPNDKSVQDMVAFVGEVFADNGAVHDFLRLMKYTQQDMRLLKLLVSAIPKKIASDERILAAKNKLLPPTKWGEKSVVFFCGGAWEDWVDSSVVGGIGGSEEATIYLARELTALGYKVTVYNQCGELAGDYKGVEYRSYLEFNPRDTFNILISWRQNLCRDVKAKRRIIWLHDVPTADMFLEEDVNTYDKVIVLSQFHKSLLQNVPEEKIFVSRNGLNMKDFEGINEERNPKRVIYASSYDRGLEEFLKIWPLVVQKVPDAELHIFYGWNTYDEMIKTGRRSPEFKDKMVELMRQRNIHEHGRVGHKRLNREYSKSGIWGYPTTFEEISCIGAMRAQVTGAVPVINNYAALKETVEYGARNGGDVKDPKTHQEFAQKLIEMLQNVEIQEEIRRKMMQNCKTKFSWEGVAKSWETNLF